VHMARPKREEQSLNKRIQMDMPPTSVTRLKALQEITESSSYSEVIRNALRLYEAIISEVESGGQLLIKKDGNTSEFKVFSA